MREVLEHSVEEKRLFSFNHIYTLSPSLRCNVYTVKLSNSTFPLYFLVLSIVLCKSIERVRPLEIVLLEDSNFVIADKVGNIKKRINYPSLSKKSILQVNLSSMFRRRYFGVRCTVVDLGAGGHIGGQVLHNEIQLAKC